MNNTQNTQENIDLISNQALRPTDRRLGTKTLGNKTAFANIIYAKQNDTWYAYKSSDQQSAFRNLMMAQKLRKHGIPVPDSKMYINNHHYFEKYELIPGNTLSETLQTDTLSDQDIKQIVHDVLECDKKISEIQVPNQEPFLFLSDKRKQYHQETYGKFITHIYYTLKKIRIHKQSLHHADLNSSNILLDNNNKFKALLDIDGIAVCDKYTMLVQLLLYIPNLSASELAKMYKSIFNEKVNPALLKILYTLVKTAKDFSIYKTYSKTR